MLINRLNVYPVPDGDTGTNMALTLESVTGELDGLDGLGGPDLEAACRAIAHGSLMGARGNSGVILSQLLRGITEGLTCPTGNPGARELSEALTIADKLAREAVMRPVEGTILTVARGAAERARDAADAGHSLVGVAESVAGGCGRGAGPHPLAASRAGAGRGGRRRGCRVSPAVRRAPLGARRAPDARTPRAFRSVFVHRRAGPDRRRCRPRRRRCRLRRLAGLRYEVMYLLEAPDDTIPSFKEVWAGMGDSIVVVGGDGLWNCHIHTDDIGAAIEASLDAGRPRTIRVTDLLEQVEEERWVREGAGTGGQRSGSRPRRGRPRPPAWWRWPPVTGSGASSAPSASRGSSPAGSP
jgi:hypothetical protein